MPRWIKVFAVLVLVWAVAGGVILALRAARPSAETFAALIEKNQLAGLSDAKRAAVIDEAADQLNRLNYEEREKLRRLKMDHRLFEQMNEAERRAFLEKTLPEGFRQMMLALNEMKPEERKKIVQRALDNIERDSPEIAGRIQDKDAQKVIAEGLGAFYDEANAEVKLDFAPVIEQLQRATQGLR